MNSVSEIPYDSALDTTIGEEKENDSNWRDFQITSYSSYTGQESYGSNQRLVPQDSWLFPPDYTVKEVLGKHFCKLEKIRQDTGASFKYNESMRQVDIWGDYESIYRARHMMDSIVDRLQQQRDATKPKSRKWNRPDRELTEKEQKRSDRKLAQQAEDRTYRKYPDPPYQYKAVMPFPDKSVHPKIIFGNRNEYLNRLRAECKCYIRYNDSRNMVELTHKVEANVILAARRLRNWYLSLFRTPAITVTHTLKQPSTNMVVQFRTLPSDFRSNKYAPSKLDREICDDGRLLEGLTTGIVHDQIPENLDLINLNNDYSQGDINIELPDTLKNLDKDNAIKMKAALEIGLESIRLTKWDIKMKVRFGHTVITKFPRNNAPRSLESLIDKTLSNKNYVSKLAPCIAENIEEIHDMFAWLSHCCTEYTDSPNTSYVIEAEQCLSLPDNFTGSHRQQWKLIKDNDQWNTTLIANFTTEKRVGMWRCLAEQLDVTTIQCADLQDNYDWELKLQRAVHLPKDKIHGTPHSRFVDSLELHPESDRLIFSPNPISYNPILITQKTKWIYAYDNDWNIELTREETWDVRLLNITPERYYLPVDLSLHAPHRTIFKLAMYRVQWITRFSENSLLGIGEAPSWIPSSFLSNPKDEKETLESMVDTAQTVKKILSKKCLI